jgi:hypothetical protein
MIDRLVNARLLVLRHENDTVVVEVAHEALLRKWPLLRSWLDEEREFLIGKQDLGQDIIHWTQASKSSDALLSGLKLARAREWLMRRSHFLNDSEREFIRASISQQKVDTAFRWVVVCSSMIFVLQDTFFLWIIYFGVSATYLRPVIVGICFFFGVVLFWQLRCRFAHASALGIAAGLLGALLMLIMVSAVDNVTVMPSNANEWREIVEYVGSMTFATVAGNTSAEFTEKLLHKTANNRKAFILAAIAVTSLVARFNQFEMI